MNGVDGSVYRPKQTCISPSHNSKTVLSIVKIGPLFCPTVNQGIIFPKETVASGDIGLSGPIFLRGQWCGLSAAASPALRPSSSSSSAIRRAAVINTRWFP